MGLRFSNYDLGHEAVYAALKFIFYAQPPYLGSLLALSNAVN